MPLSRVGQVLGGRYRIDAQLGEGGQSTVWRAHDLAGGRDVAVKVLRTDARDPEARERMLREAQAMAALSGTATVSVIDQAPTPEGALALVMELLQGSDYEQFLEQHEARGELVPIPTMLELFRPIVFALERAHSHGIIHRDLKPQNLFVTDDGRGGYAPKLLDFGFAKFLKARAITAAGMIAGSPPYLAPEMWKGAPSFDQRVDVYALAVIFFRTLTGKLPFEGKIVELMFAVTTTEPRPKPRALRPALPPLIDDWAQAALAIDPANRFHGVGAMYTALTRALT